MKRLALLIIVPVSMLLGATQPKTYQTSFPATEDPISQGGAWVNAGPSPGTGLDWGNVQTTPGLAFGTNIQGGPPFSDSSAALSGTWSGNQKACGVVFISPSLNRTNGGFFPEVEVHTNFTIAAHNTTGYEFTYSVRNGGLQYAGITRWNGALNDFTPGLGTTISSVPALTTGDSICMSRTSSTLKAWMVHAGVTTVITTATDSTFTNGAPGIGFYNQGGQLSDNSLYGFSSFQAAETDVPPPAPTNLRITGTQ